MRFFVGIVELFSELEFGALEFRVKVFCKYSRVSRFIEKVQDIRGFLY